MNDSSSLTNQKTSAMLSEERHTDCSKSNDINVEQSPLKDTVTSKVTVKQEMQIDCVLPEILTNKSSTAPKATPLLLVPKKENGQNVEPQTVLEAAKLRTVAKTSLSPKVAAKSNLVGNQKTTLPNVKQNILVNKTKSSNSKPVTSSLGNGKCSTSTLSASTQQNKTLANKSPRIIKPNTVNNKVIARPTPNLPKETALVTNTVKNPAKPVVKKPIALEKASPPSKTPQSKPVAVKTTSPLTIPAAVKSPQKVKSPVHKGSPIKMPVSKTPQIKVAAAKSQLFRAQGQKATAIKTQHVPDKLNQKGKPSPVNSAQISVKDKVKSGNSVIFNKGKPATIPVAATEGTSTLKLSEEENSIPRTLLERRDGTAKPVGHNLKTLRIVLTRCDNEIKKAASVPVAVNSAEAKDEAVYAIQKVWDSVLEKLTSENESELSKVAEEKETVLPDRDDEAEEKGEKCSSVEDTSQVDMKIEKSDSLEKSEKCINSAELEQFYKEINEEERKDEKKEEEKCFNSEEKKDEKKEEEKKGEKKEEEKKGEKKEEEKKDEKKEEEKKDEEKEEEKKDEEKKDEKKEEEKKDEEKKDEEKDKERIGINVQKAVGNTLKEPKLEEMLLDDAGEHLKVGNSFKKPVPVIKMKRSIKLKNPAKNIEMAVKKTVDIKVANPILLKEDMKRRQEELLRNFSIPKKKNIETKGPPFGLLKIMETYSDMEGESPMAPTVIQLDDDQTSSLIMSRERPKKRLELGTAITTTTEAKKSEQPSPRKENNQVAAKVADESSNVKSEIQEPPVESTIKLSVVSDATFVKKPPSQPVFASYPAPKNDEIKVIEIKEVKEVSDNKTRSRSRSRERTRSRGRSRSRWSRERSRSRDRQRSRRRRSRSRSRRKRSISRRRSFIDDSDHWNRYHVVKGVKLKRKRSNSRERGSSSDSSGKRHRSDDFASKKESTNNDGKNMSAQGVGERTSRWSTFTSIGSVVAPTYTSAYFTNIAPQMVPPVNPSLLPAAMPASVSPTVHSTTTAPTVSKTAKLPFNFSAVSKNISDTLETLRIGISKNGNERTVVKSGESQIMENKSRGNFSGNIIKKNSVESVYEELAAALLENFCPVIYDSRKDDNDQRVFHAVDIPWEYDDLHKFSDWQKALGRLPECRRKVIDALLKDRDEELVAVLMQAPVEEPIKITLKDCWMFASGRQIKNEEAVWENFSEYIERLCSGRKKAAEVLLNGLDRYGLRAFYRFTQRLKKYFQFQQNVNRSNAKELVDYSYAILRLRQTCEALGIEIPLTAPLPLKPALAKIADSLGISENALRVPILAGDFSLARRRLELSKQAFPTAVRKPRRICVRLDVKDIETKEDENNTSEIISNADKELSKREKIRERVLNKDEGAKIVRSILEENTADHVLVLIHRHFPEKFLLKDESITMLNKIEDLSRIKFQVETVVERLKVLNGVLFVKCTDAKYSPWLGNFISDIYSHVVVKNFQDIFNNEDLQKSKWIPIIDRKPGLDLGDSSDWKPDKSKGKIVINLKRDKQSCESNMRTVTAQKTDSKVTNDDMDLSPLPSDEEFSDRDPHHQSYSKKPNVPATYSINLNDPQFYAKYSFDDKKGRNFKMSAESQKSGTVTAIRKVEYNEVPVRRDERAASSTTTFRSVQYNAGLNNLTSDVLSMMKSSGHINVIQDKAEEKTWPKLIAITSDKESKNREFSGDFWRSNLATAHFQKPIDDYSFKSSENLNSRYAIKKFSASQTKEVTGSRHRVERIVTEEPRARDTVRHFQQVEEIIEPPTPPSILSEEWDIDESMSSKTKKKSGEPSLIELLMAIAKDKRDDRSECKEIPSPSVESRPSRYVTSFTESRPIRMETTFPGMPPREWNPHSSLELLKEQNPGLDISRWKIDCFRMESTWHMVLLTIDEGSANFIKKNNYRLRYNKLSVDFRLIK